MMDNPLSKSGLPMRNGFIATSEYGILPALACGMETTYFYDYDTACKQKPLRNGARALLHILRQARQKQVVMLSSSTLVECLAIARMGTWPREQQPIVILFGDMFAGKKRLKRLGMRLLIRLMDRAVDGYIVQSTDDQRIFPHTWKVNPDKVHVALFGYTFHDSDIHEARIRTGDYIFAGGNSQRDYDTLVEVARQMPDQQFIFATRTLQGRRDIPANVIAEPVPHKQYLRLMEQSRLVVTAIRRGLLRAVGQQTYLNAMRLGKLSIVNERDVLGLQDYIVHGQTGLLVDGSPESYAAAIRWALDSQNAEQVQRICLEARHVVQANFSYAHFLERLSVAANTIILSSSKPVLHQNPAPQIHLATPD